MSKAKSTAAKTVTTKRQESRQRAFDYHSQFFFMTAKDGSVAQIVICRRCGQKLNFVDVAGRRNYFGLVSHTS
jgi:hypothetical protein